MADVQRAAHRGRRRVDRVDVLARLGAVEGVGLLGAPALRPLGLEALESRLVGYDDGAWGRRRLRCLVLRGLGHSRNPRCERVVARKRHPRPTCTVSLSTAHHGRATDRGIGTPMRAPTTAPRARTGCDLQRVDDVTDAIRDFGARYLDRVYTPAEQEAAPPGGAASLAARFAAKEAVLKLIGTADGVDLRSVEITHQDGRPVVRLSGLAADLAEEAGRRPDRRQPQPHRRPRPRGRRRHHPTQCPAGRRTQHDAVRDRHDPRAPRRARQARRRRRLPVRHRRPLRRRA